MPSIFPNLLAGTKITDPLKLGRVGPNSLTLLNWKSLSYAFFVLRRKIPAKSDTNTFLVSNTNTVTSKLYFPHLLLQEPMEEFKMESFHPAEPLVASELPSPLVSKPPKEFADETSSTASEAATSASAAATVATIDHHHHHHHHPVGNVSFFVLKAFSSRCDSCGLCCAAQRIWGRFCFTKEPKGKMRKDAEETYFSSSFFDHEQH